MKLFLVRHTQTEANRLHIIQGQNNTEISDEGIEILKRASTFFQEIHIDTLYSSPLKRAVETAKSIAIASDYSCDNIVLDGRLMEIDLSPWAMKKISDLDHSDAASSYKTYKQQPSEFIPSAGEGFGDVQKRMVEFISYVVSNSKQNDTIVIVSHSVAIRSLLLGIENKSVDYVWQYPITSASITEIDYSNGQYTIEKCGYVV